MFLDLSIDIEQNSSVTACLRQFSASEMLCQRNKFFCDSCCGLQEAEKRMKIKRLPNILALHLKRFKYQEDLNKYVKLNYRVAFPFQLRLFNTVDDAADMDRLYELWAIVVHIGRYSYFFIFVEFSGKFSDQFNFLLRTAGRYTVTTLPSLKRKVHGSFLMTTQSRPFASPIFQNTMETVGVVQAMYYSIRLSTWIERL